jgi:hypothetical protein
MKNKLIALSLLILSAGTFSCRKYLDINSDPTSPQTPDLASLMVPATSIMSKMASVDIVSVSQYIQNFSHITAGEGFDVHAGNGSTGSTQNALWRSFYAQQGQNINLVIEKGIQDERWDYVGAATALRAWGLMMSTNYFGEMPYYEAWRTDKYTFAYDSQERIYKAIDSLCVVAINYLERTDGGVNQTSMSRGDRVYAGDRSKWIKFVYGLRARQWQRLSNKPEYRADSVIAFLKKSFTSNADNFYISHTATRNDDTSPLGPGRDNFSARRQSRMIVQLLDGSIFHSTTFGVPINGTTIPDNRDPRIRGMLSVSPDTTTIGATMPTPNGGYRYLSPTVGDVNSGAAAGTPLFRQRPSTPYGDSAIINPAISNFGSSVGKYLFRNNALFPIMTYHELLFIRAEAEYMLNGAGASHEFYRDAISKHFDFVDLMNTNSNPGISPVVPFRTGYLASKAVKTPSTLTLTDVMLQKYIGDWGWNYMETWSDMRRYHYNFDIDPKTGFPVYFMYSVPLFSSNNQGPKFAYRYRPTNFSEFDWNFEELKKLGVGNIDYHTYEMWFSKF